MWMFIMLLWRIVGRVLRRVGWGGLLVPVAAMGIVVLGVTLWTVAAVMLAAVLAVQRPRAAAGLLPAALICAGLWGLILASTTPGAVSLTAMPSWSISYLTPGAVPLKVQPGKAVTYRETWRPGSVPRGVTVTWTVVPSLGAIPAPPGKVPPPRGALLPLMGPVHLRAIAGVVAGPGQVMAGKPAGPGYVVGKGGGPGRMVSALVQVPRAVKNGVATPAVAWAKFRAGPVRVFIGGPPSPVRFLRNWMLVPLALLMLTLGLWLMPQSLARLRQRAGPLVPYLRHKAREIGWGLALVPATAIGMSVFGVNPWTATAVAAAVAVTVWWPKVAADLVPFVLVALALRGFQLAVQWQSLSAGLTSPGVHYGFVTVDGPRDALAAGAEASVFLAVGAWLVPRTIGRRLGTVFTSGPDADLAGRVARLTESRGHAVDAAAAELRRIERDLHDGAQARLVALGMNLRAVERVLPGSPQAALALVAEARETSVRALTELRDLIRGICPPVLADRGLGHAVQALVLDTPLPTALEVDLPGRLPAPVESACYFAVAEALANAVKHSGARHAGIRIKHDAGLLRIEVADDGVGGADPGQGTGLQGVERRLGTFDGIMAVSSPPGGPTMIVMEVPCALLSPKTCSC
jgi:signal transduction histidine kinase